MKRIARWTVGGMVALVVGLGGCGVAPTPLEQTETAQTETQQTETQQTETQQTETQSPEAAPSRDAMPPGSNAKTTGDAAEPLGMVDGEAYEAAVPSGYAGNPVEDYNTEEYDSVEEVGFVSTKARPLSTISADVDTASYANLRRMLKDGYHVAVAAEGDKDKDEDKDKDKDEDTVEEPKDQPEAVEAMPEDEGYYGHTYDERVIPTGAVRIEEMLNYFNYDYPAPEGAEPFAISARIGACPWNKDTDLLVLGYATGKEDEAMAKKGSNLVFLIDVSGSMDSPDKLDLLKDAFAELTKSLGENDRVSVVTYSGQEEVVLEGVKGTDRTEIMRAIRALKADGSTNGEAGLKMAYEIAEKNFIEGGVNRIVMASDGDLNVGMSSESDLHDFVDKQREKGVYLSVLGFGTGNYKDNKMETLADHGNGSYHYIDGVLEAKRVFGERLTANLVPFADDVKVQVEFNPSKVKGYRLIGYENRAMADEDFKDDTKDAAEVGPNSQFTVVYEIVRADSAFDVPTPELKYEQQSEQTTATDEWLTAKLRYKPVAENDVREQELVVGEANRSDDPGDDWRFVAAVSEFGMLLRDSEFKGTSTYESVRALVGDTKDELRLDFCDLVDMAATN